MCIINLESIERFFGILTDDTDNLSEYSLFEEDLDRSFNLGIAPMDISHHYYKKPELNF
jgi:hypothetical protein